MNTIDKIYNLRSKFSVIALTGVTGSGCSELAQLMELESFEDFEKNVRSPKDFEQAISKKQEIFRRKYERAYALLKAKYQNYRIISYKNAVILETIILLLKNEQSVGSAINKFCDILVKQFIPGKEDTDYPHVPLTITNKHLTDWKIRDIFEKIASKIKFIEDWDNQKNDWRLFIADFFFSTEYKSFCSALFEYLKGKDYYLKNFLVHRIANSIRSFGNPEIIVDEDNYKDADMKYLFFIIGLINDIIKGCSHDGSRNFVIDSLRCSLEIVYLRERYNAFYMICMHNEKCIQTIESKVSKYTNKKELVASKIYSLGECEIRTKQYEEGIFSVPDIYNCIANSEIHIFKRELAEMDNVEACTEFYSTAEQWMKVLSLILHPGLFTPSSDERCMSIAFQVKFNSGCISRQVGCVITDENYTIRSIGWNDVPMGQIPCGLTDVDEFCEGKHNNGDYLIYSKFEEEGKWRDKTNAEGLFVEKEFTFKDKMKEAYPKVSLTKNLNDNGLYTPFCFKSCYNSFKDQKDNVNTRSLHAEENTMLQISRIGGIGLNGGKMFVTASPCVLCSKKAYQIGIKEIVFLDRYTDIAEDQILGAGFDKPLLRGFCGIVGATYYKLYQPFMSFKDELKIRLY